MTETVDARTRGIDFGAFADALAACEYPVACADLVDRYGDHELEHANGTERVAEVLGPVEEEFASAREVRETVVGLVGMDAVGRKRYTDRGGRMPGDRDGSRPLSL